MSFRLPFSLMPTLLAGACALSACTVGPDYAARRRWRPPPRRRRTSCALPATGFVTTRAPSPWWHALNDPQLSALIEAALAHNPDVHAAQARLREARAQLQQQRADGMPKASFDAAALRTREPDLSAFGSGSGSGGQAPATSGGGPLHAVHDGF